MDRYLSIAAAAIPAILSALAALVVAIRRAGNAVQRENATYRKALSGYRAWGVRAHLHANRLLRVADPEMAEKWDPALREAHRRIFDEGSLIESDEPRPERDAAEGDDV